MSNASAHEYAESIAAEIRANVENGTPFGVVSDDNPVTDRENGDELDAIDWLDGVLDIQYLVNRERQYRSARVCIAYGGPTAWIDTRTGMLECAWWSGWESVELPHEFIAGLDDALSELYGDY
jgi:hypothetical protein